MNRVDVDQDEARRLAADRARIRAADPERYDRLAEGLIVAVPAEIEAARGLTEQRRVSRGDWLRVMNLLGARGDVLLYGGGQPGETAAVFARLAETLAILAFAPGGVTVFGLHWCAVSHAWCPGATTWKQINETPGGAA